ncbi:hypothetical protein [Geodermatophilus chilensis]|uniref:hypothetical protein n=1 Tax=Geodermatophilus chilensis TaxID=2035835 RepID=UPI000C2562E1|nr:hypothetical protein [Geodermatophilus chilensis]
MRPTSRPLRPRTVGTVLTLAAAVSLTACNSAAPSASGSGEPDTGPVSIGVGGQPLLAYLPTTLAD